MDPYYYEEDPDELLSRQRHLVRAWMDHGELDEEGVCELVQVTAQLDACLTDGGARPLEWRSRPLPRRTDDLPPLLTGARCGIITSGRTAPERSTLMAHTKLSRQRWVTADGLWRVTVTGRVMRVETHGALGWVHRADAATTAEVTRWVPLRDLEEARRAA